MIVPGGAGPGTLSATQSAQVIVVLGGTVTDVPVGAVICAAAGGAAMVANSGTIRAARERPRRLVSVTSCPGAVV